MNRGRSGRGRDRRQALHLVAHAAAVFFASALLVHAAPAEAAAPERSLVVRTVTEPRIAIATSDQFEAVLKYPPVSAGGEVSGRLYLSDFETNRPLEGARALLTVPAINRTFIARPTSTPGVYMVPLRFERNGRFGGIVRVEHPSFGVGRAEMKGLAIGRHRIVSDESIRSRQIGLTLLLLTLLVVGIAGWLYLGRHQDDSLVIRRDRR